MFSIGVLPASRLGPEGERLGEITIGDFAERFACDPGGESLARMEARWRRELRRLIRGAPAVALVHDPRLAWVVYREGERCYVQQRLSPGGGFPDLLPRRTEAEDGDRVSEWTTTVPEIRHFLLFRGHPGGPAGRDRPTQSRAANLLGDAIAGGVSFCAIVVVAFALTGRWPSQAITLGSSIGGLCSPAFWRWVQRRRERRPDHARGESP